MSQRLDHEVISARRAQHPSQVCTEALGIMLEGLQEPAAMHIMYNSAQQPTDRKFPTCLHSCMSLLASAQDGKFSNMSAQRQVAAGISTSRAGQALPTGVM
jgi:hypothetical protein